MVAKGAKAAAKAAGEARYTTGKPCKYGHLAERCTTDGRCVECSRLKETSEQRRARRDANLEKEHAQAKARRDADLEKARSQARSWYADNRETVLAQQAASNAANPEKNRARVKAWRQANPEKKRTAAALYRERRRAADMERRKAAAAERRATAEARREVNKERRRAQQTRWIKDNPEKVRAVRHRRRARNKKAEGFFTADDIARIYKAQKGRCAYCRCKLGADFHRDHVIALASGGTNWPSNIQLTCDPCNRSKGAKDPIRFAQARGMLL